MLFLIAIDLIDYYIFQSSPQRYNGHAHSSAHATPISKPRSKSKTECSSLEKRRLSRGDLQNDSVEASEEYTKMLRRRMISEVLQQKPIVFDLTKFCTLLKQINIPYFLLVSALE